MRHASTTFFVLLLAAVSLPMGCKFPSVVDEVKAGSGATASAGARLILNIGGVGAANGGARTIVPDTSGLALKYSVLLQKGATSQTASSTASQVIIPGLEPGTWSITVSGLDASDNLQAQGATSAFVGADQTVSATVTLALIQSGGTGAVNLTLTFPHSVGVDAVDATLAGNAVAPALSILPVDATTDRVVLSQPGVTAGSPLLRVFFKKAGTVLAGVMETVWVFQNVTTTGSINLQSSDFGAPPSAPTGLGASGAHDGSLVLAWTDTSNVADAYVVRRSSAPGGPFAQVGADLPFTATGFSDTGLAAGTTCYYQVTAKNRFGESPIASASATTFSAVAMPTFAPAPGPTYGESQTISFSSATSGATIYYTIDGTPPSSSSTHYTGPVSLSGHGSAVALKAIAVAAGMTDSSVAAAAYAIDRKPVITGFAASHSAVLRGQSFTITTTAFDPEGGAVTYAYALTAGAGTVTGAGASATASVSAAGANTITVTVTDSFGNQETASMNVTGVNQAPLLSLTASTSPVYLNWDTSVYPNLVIPDTKALSFTANDPDGDTPLTYAYSVTSGFGSVSGSGSTATFATGTSAGMSTVHAVVTDSRGASASMDVQVKAVGWNELADADKSRYGHSAIYDGAGNMIVFGGNVMAGASNDLLRFNIATNTWSTITSTGGPPAPRAYHSAIYHDGKMVVFGGLNSITGVAYKDVWELDLGTYAWTQLPSSPVYGLPADTGVYDHSTVYDGNGNMIVFGGMVYGSSAANNQVWKYSFSSGGWTQLSPSGGPPPARCAHSAIYGGNGKMIVFGGGNDPNTPTIYYNDVWRYDISMNAWQQLASANPPVARYFPCAIYDGGDNMAIFGGSSGGWLNDVWQYRISSQSWTKITSATANITPGGVYGRIKASAVYDGNGHMIIFGGINNNIPEYNTWQFVLP